MIDDDETVKLGWLTTRHSKPILTECFKTLLKNGISGIRWVGTASEVHTYVYDKKGRMNAQEGCFDDQLETLAEAVNAEFSDAARLARLDKARSDAYSGQIKCGIGYVEVYCFEQLALNALCQVR